MSADRLRPTAAERIDAHHHIWDLEVRPQGWTAHTPIIDRTFTIDELEPQLADSHVNGTVLVETINVRQETAELLAVAAKHPTIRGVVGWVDLTAPDVDERIAALREAPGGERLVGLRHQVQAEPDPGWLRRPEVLRGLATVARAGLVFDLLVQPHQLGAAIDAVHGIDEGRFVLDHAGKPPIASGALEPWATLVGVLAAYENVACKLSGMVTEASPRWTVADLEPYAGRVLSDFGPDRVMAGSDWPVCLLRADHATVWAANEQLASELTEPERAQVLGGTATTWYGLS
jgi:L-fuconolactonase